MMNSNLIENRHIRVFISSTFQDMQDERDYLMKRTFPKLRKLAAERDVTLTELDLRWGITEEESKSGKVVEICLREIENSIPFFIGIIGNRYGWVPFKDDLNGNVTKRFPKVNKYLDRHLSVTEMEMQFGVLERDEDMHAYFFIKEQEEEADNLPMLNQLKEAVKSSRYPSTYYSSLEDLASQVESAFRELIDGLFPEWNLSELEKERIGQRSFMNQLCRNYIRDDRNFLALDEWLQDWEKHQLVVTGASGLGKSALLANWVKEKLADNGRYYNIIYHFVGNGGSESNHEHISKVISDEIKNQYGWNDQNDFTESKLEDLVMRVVAEREKPLLIVLDAINQIVDADNAKLLNWLPIPIKNVKILFSTLEDDLTMEVFKNRNYPIFTLQPLDIYRRKELVNRYLHDDYAKTLTTEQVERIIGDTQCQNTLVLKTLLDELINFGIYEKLDEKIDCYLSKDTIEDFYQELLQSYEEEYDYVDTTFLSIFLSKYGLKEHEILSVANVNKLEELKIRPLDWSQLSCALHNHLKISNGLVSFTHEYFSNAVKTRYFDRCYDTIMEWSIRTDIIDCLMEDGIQPKDFRLCGEIAFQKYCIGLLPFKPSFFQTEYDNPELEKLFLFLSDISVFYVLFKNAPFDLAKYWKVLAYKEEYSIHSIYIYNGYFNNIIENGNFEELDFEYALSLTIFCRDYLDDYYSSCNYGEIMVSIAEMSNNNDIIAKAYYELGLSYIDYKILFSKGGEYIHKAYDIVKSDIKLKINILKKLGDIFIRSNTYKACSFFDEAMNLAEKEMGKYSIEYAMIEEAKGRVLALYRGWPRALHHYANALKIKKDLYGEESVYVADTYLNIGEIYWEYLERALRIYKKLLGDGHTKYTDTISKIIENKFDSELYQESNSLLDEKLNILIRKNDIILYRKDIAETYADLGYANYKLNDYSTALRYFELSYQTKSEYNEKVELESKANSYLYMGITHIQLGNVELGLPEINVSYQCMKEKYSPKSIDLERHVKRIVNALKEILMNPAIEKRKDKNKVKEALCMYEKLHDVEGE